MLGIILAVTALWLCYWLYNRKYFYFQRNNVPQSEAPLPFFGDHLSLFMKKKSFSEVVEATYRMFPNARFMGFYQLTTANLMVRDPDLIKQIGVKDFDHFTDHRPVIPDDVEPLWGRNLFLLKGEEWRNMRSTLSPTFTSSKMKQMFVLMSECAGNFIEHFKTKVGSDPVTLDMKDVFTRFANDIIATCAFGIRVDSLADKENEFYSMGKQATDFSGFFKGIKFFLGVISPKILKLFNLRLFDAKQTDFFFGLMSETIKTREEKHIVRPDMINLLIEARKNKGKVQEETQIQDTSFAAVQEHIKPSEKVTILTDMDITAQALIFFFAGFDTVSTVMSFASYELAVNPDVQERLQKEVDATWEKCDGKITYEALMGMKYLDMVISETLRKWPNPVATDRVCVKPYTIEPKRPDEKPFKINVGDVLWIPTFGIHRDEQYYPDPEKFDPDRFNEENRTKIHPYAYMPFGVGPRNCIGSRFALMEVKLLYFHILRNFTLVPVEETQIPMKISRKTFSFVAEKGHWIGMKQRNKIL